MSAEADERRAAPGLWITRGAAAVGAGPAAPPSLHGASRLFSLGFGPVSEGAQLAVALPIIAGDAQAMEHWWVQGPVRCQQTHHHGLSVTLCEGGAHWFASARVDTASPASVREASEHLYRALLGLLRVRAPDLHLLRIWNYLPHINADQAGEERYRLFNSGRKAAFHALGLGLGQGAPAACALGTCGDALQVAILAGRQAALPIENARQISAYRYPAQYGSDAPQFSRAAWHPHQAGQILLVSGTASIVGHASQHLGDVVLQTQESLRNIQTLLDAAHAQGACRWTLAELMARVYLRHADDWEPVREVLAQAGVTAALVVQADVCRAELLVEIEGQLHTPQRVDRAVTDGVAAAAHPPA